MNSDALIVPTARGLYCPAGDFYIDPWRPTDRAFITHGHADHARPGSRHYVTSSTGVPVLRHRLGRDQAISGLAYRTPVRCGEVWVSLHPAGHILGSVQIRVERSGKVWVFTGDFKRDTDPTCEPFEVVPCDVLITEATFALPVYRWPPVTDVVADIYDWWQRNAENGRPSVLFTYALGKAQRILAGLLRHTEQTVWLHGAMVPLTDIYRGAGIAMVPTIPASESGRSAPPGNALVLAPPSAAGTPWMRRFRRASTGLASGWMQIRGNRRRRGYDRGFVLSDHADWPGLLRTFKETGAKHIYTTHGRSEELVAYLNGMPGPSASALETLYGDGE